jgi:hypothetical protein
MLARRLEVRGQPKVMRRNLAIRVNFVDRINQSLVFCRHCPADGYAVERME